MVRFENVGMRYGAGPEVLRDVTFALEAGSFTFLTGLSGAGKTTLLKLIYIDEPPSRGLITLFGHDLSAPNGATFRPCAAASAWCSRISACSTISRPSTMSRCRCGWPAGASGDYAHDVEELLSWVGLGDRMQRRPATLSGGEQQRVAIARAVVARPDLLIADEPTGNVDPEMGARLIRLFGELNRLGTTVLIATHDRALIEATRAREMRLVDGRLVELRRAAFMSRKGASKQHPAARQGRRAAGFRHRGDGVPGGAGAGRLADRATAPRKAGSAGLSDRLTVQMLPPEQGDAARPGLDQETDAALSRAARNAGHRPCRAAVGRRNRRCAGASPGSARTALVADHSAAAADRRRRSCPAPKSISLRLPRS